MRGGEQVGWVVGDQVLSVSVWTRGEHHLSFTQELTLVHLQVCGMIPELLSHICPKEPEWSFLLPNFTSKNQEKENGI